MYQNMFKTPESHIKGGFWKIAERCKESVLDNSGLEKTIHLSGLGGMCQNMFKMSESHIKSGFWEIWERDKESVFGNSKLGKTIYLSELEACIKTCSKCLQVI